VLEVVKRFCAHWGGASSWELSGAQGPHEAHYLKLDCSKASTYLGWQPRWNLDEAIARIVDWNRTHQKGGDLRAMTLAQISDYPQT
ncbi:MAG: rfbG, partial [Ramlibacter sp.]|nr:rfbG [Ramlibacter sp.]